MHFDFYYVHITNSKYCVFYAILSHEIPPLPSLFPLLSPSSHKLYFVFVLNCFLTLSVSFSLYEHPAYFFCFLSDLCESLLLIFICFFKKLGTINFRTVNNNFRCVLLYNSNLPLVPKSTHQYPKFPLYP